MQPFVGLCWPTRRARWRAMAAAGAVIDEAWAPATRAGFAGLLARPGLEAVACLEMMGGAALAP